MPNHSPHGVYHIIVLLPTCGPCRPRRGRGGGGGAGGPSHTSSASKAARWQRPALPRFLRRQMLSWARLLAPFLAFCFPALQLSPMRERTRETERESQVFNILPLRCQQLSLSQLLRTHTRAPTVRTGQEEVAARCVCYGRSEPSGRAASPASVLPKDRGA